MRSSRSARLRLATLALVALVAASVVGLTIIQNAYAATVCDWSGGTGNWNLTTNWTCTAGGTNHVPISTDEVTISSGTVTVNANASVAKITLSGTGAITMNATNTLTVSGSYIQSAGTFTGGAPAVNLGDFNLSGGTFIAPSGTLTIGTATDTGAFTHSAGTFTHNSGTVVFAGGAATISVPTNDTFNAVTFNPSTANALKTVADGNTLIAIGTLTLTDGGFNQTTIPAAGTVAARGNIVQTNTNSDDSSGTIVIDGTAAQTLTGNSSGLAGAFPNIVINKASGTLTLVGSIRTLRDWTYVAGTVAPGTSTLVFSKSTGTPQTLTLDGPRSLTGVIIQGSGTTGGLAITGGTLTVTGNLDLRDGNFASGTINAQGAITENSGALSFDGGNGTIVIGGSGAQTLTGTAVAGSSLPNIQINKTNTLTLSGTINTNNNWTLTAGTLAAGASTMRFGGGTITGTQSLFNVELNGATDTTATTIATGTTVTAAGTTTLTNGLLAGAGTLAATGTTITQASTFDGGTGNLAITGTASPTFTGSANTTAGDLPAVTINKASGTLTLAGTIRTSQPWTYTLGTLAAGASSFVSAGATFTGAQTLNNLDVRAASTIASGDLTVGGTLTLNGNLSTGANKVIIPSAGTVTRVSGSIVGTERKQFATGAAQSFTYDIGGTTSYRPVALANLNVTTAGSGLDASVTQANGQHPNVGSSTINSTKDVQRYWTLTPQGGFAASTYDAIFTFVGADVIGAASPTAFIAGKYSGSWSYPTVGTKTATTTQITGVTTGFGDYALGEVAPTDGVGTMALDRSSFSASTQTGDITFTYTAAATMTGGTVSVDLPTGWTAPQTATPGSAGYITPSTGTATATGQNVTVTGVTLAASGTLTITYKTPTPPATLGAVTFQTKQSATGGTPLVIATQPTATVYAADGSGTGVVSPTAATAGTTATLDFTYTAATGGLSGGAVTVLVPATWTQPQTSSSGSAGYVTASVNGGAFSTTNVAVTGTGPWTVTVSPVTIAAAQTVVIRYGDTTAAAVQPRAGTASFPVQEKSVAGGTLTTVATPTVAVAASADGAGTAGITPATAVAGSTSNTLLLTYTATTGGLTGGAVTAAVPAGWSAPQTSSNTTAGYVTASINGTAFTTLNVAVTGTGPWTITVSGVDINSGQTVQIRYGDTTSGANPAAAATAPSRTGTSSFQLQEKSTSGGVLTNVGAAQTVAVGAAVDGAGSAGVSPSSVTAGTTGNLLAFTYTAAAGGTTGGAVTLGVPAGWTAPQTASSSAAGYVTANIAGAGFSTTGVAVTGTGPWTITVSALDLNAGNTVIIRYGDPGAGSSQVTAPLRTGSGSFQLMEKSTSGGTLQNVGAAQTVTVNASANGAGSASVTPTTISVSTSTTLNVTYTAVAGGTTGGAVTVQVPASWTAPQTSLSTTAGYVTASVAGGAFSTSGVAVTGTGPWTITVSALDLNAGNTVIIRYGDTSGNASGAAVSPSVGETSSFPVQEKSTSGGTLTTVSTPTVTVTGAPTMQSATVNGSTLVITWSQALSTAQTGIAGSAFSVNYTSGSALSVAGTGTVTYPDSTHTQVTLASALHFADAITKVTYTTPGSDPQIRGASPTTPSATHNITSGFTNNTANNGPSTPGSLSPANNFATQSGQPTLQGTYLDADPNDTAAAKFDVCSDSSCTTIVRTSTNPGVASGATTSWQVTPALAEGTYYWRLTTTDSGNASTSSAIRSFVVDQTAPTIPTFTISRSGQSFFNSGTSTYYYSPAAGTQSGTLDITAAASDGSGSGVASIAFPAISLPGFSGGGNTVNASSGSATQYVFNSSNTTAPADVVVTATDRAGNTSLAAAGTVHFVRDVTLPTGGTISVPGSSSSTSVTITSNSYSDAGSQIATNTITRSGAQAPSGGVCPGSGYTGATVVTSPDTVPGDGCYVYTLTGVDNVGNTAAIASSPILVDTTGPSAAISTPTAGFHKPSQLATFSGTAADSGSGVAGVTLRIHDNTANKDYNGTAFAPTPTTVPATGTTSWTRALDTSTLVNGDSYTVTVSVTDVAGNTTASAATQSFTVDSANPTGVITVPSGAATFNASALATLSGTAADTGGAGVTSVTIEIHDVTTNKDYTGTVFQTGTSYNSVTGTTSWTYAVDTTKFTNGDSYTVSIQVTDGAGNTDSNAAARSFAIDNTGPTVVPTIDTFPASSTSSTTADFTFSAGADTDRNHFECRVDAGTWVTCSSPKSYSAVAIGSHQFDLSAVDAAGNRGTIVSKSWTVGAAPLASPTITGKPGSTSSSPTAAFVFNTPSADHYECQLDGGGFATCSSPKVYSGLATGSHTFTVRAVDSGNNPGTSTAYTWTVTPYLTSSSPSDGSTVSSAPASIVLTANKSVTWSGLTLEHEHDGAAAIASFTGQGTNQITIPFTATATGEYTVVGTINDGTNPAGQFRSHFTIWVAPTGTSTTPVDAPPSAKNAPPGSADSLTSSDQNTTISWDASTISPATASEGVVMHTDPQPVAASSTAFGLDLISRVEITATVVTNGTDTGTAVHTLDGVLQIVMKDSSGTAVPGYSSNGTTWTQISQLSGTTLPSGQQDGFYRSSNGDVHVLTRHLTIFGLGAGKVTLGAPRSLVGKVQNPATMVLYWEPPVGSPSTAHYYVYKNGVVIATLGGSEYQYIVQNPVIGDTAVYQVGADNSSGSNSPLSESVSGVPDLTGLTIDNAKALLAARGFQAGNVTTAVSNEATGTVVGQDPWPLPSYLPLGSTVNIVVSQQGTPAGSSLNVRVAAARRDAVRTRPYFTARIESTLAGQATIALTRYKAVRKTYATWSQPLTAGTNYVKLPLTKNVKLLLPGIYRLTVRVKANNESKLYSIRLYLFSKTSAFALPPRATDLLVVPGLAVTDQVTQLLSGSYSIQSTDAEGVFTVLPAPNETVGAVLVDATDGTGSIDTIRYLHFVFPDLRIIAVVASPAASAQAKQAGAALSVVSAPTPDATGAEISQVLRTTLGH